MSPSETPPPVRSRRPDPPATTKNPAPTHSTAIATLSEADEGKVLVDADGEQLGIVAKVENNTAWVDPDPGTAESWFEALGWSDADEDDLTVDGDVIDTVTDGEIRASGDA